MQSKSVVAEVKCESGRKNMAQDRGGSIYSTDIDDDVGRAQTSVGRTQRHIVNCLQVRQIADTIGAQSAGAAKMG